LSPQTQEYADTCTSTREAEHGGLGSIEDAFGDRDGQTDLHSTASTKMEQQNPTACNTEGESVDTCEELQWSQDTSGPDARNSAGET
ncbi:unnamed protein product, partial [Pylaiella littoralis]